MKERLLPLLLGATLLLTACGAASRGTDVGIITNVPSQSGAATVAAALAEEREGIHLAQWADAYREQPELAGETVDALAAEEEIGALLLHRAVPGSAEALRRAREKGIFVAVFAERTEAAELAGAADVTLLWDSESAGTLLAEQARDMGAETLVYYTLRRHANETERQLHRSAAEAGCAALGLTFVLEELPDDSYDAPTPGNEAFFAADVPEKLAQYGANTAFYAANCAMQPALLRQLRAGEGLYPQPCCASDGHGSPETDERVAAYPMGREELELRALCACAERHFASEPLTEDALRQLLEELSGGTCTLRRDASAEESGGQVFLYAMRPAPLT